MKRNLFIKPQLQLKLKHRAMELPKVPLKPLAGQGWDRNQTWSPQITFLDTTKENSVHYFRGKRILRKPQTGGVRRRSFSFSLREAASGFILLALFQRTIQVQVTAFRNAFSCQPRPTGRSTGRGTPLWDHLTTVTRAGRKTNHALSLC